MPAEPGLGTAAASEFICSRTRVMSAIASGRPPRVAFLVSGLALACGLATLGQDGTAPRGQAPAGSKSGLKKYLISASDCQRCHTSPPPGAASMLCRLTEYPVWHEQDKHKKAFEVLDGARAKE